MPTAYPDGLDTFTVTSLPEETPLSQAGPGGTHNHPEYHRDVGDAVEALQVHAAKKTHDHSGEDTSGHGPKLAQAYTHESPDTDQADSSLHHTLGDQPGQAAPGDHRHDYNGPSIYNQPYIICTSTTRPGNPAVGMQIYETDLKCVRIWDSFGTDTPITGLNSIDEFTTAHTDAWGRPSLNPADWEQWYADDPADRDHGAMGVVDPGTLSWTDEGSDTNRCIARRIKPADKETQTDDVVISWKTGSQIIEEFLPILTETAANDYFVRMSADRSAYWRVMVGNDWIRVFYTVSGPSGEKELGKLNYVDTEYPQIEWRAQLVDRTMYFYRDGISKGSIKDNKALSSKGPAFRGWAIGMQSGDRALGQTTPGSVEWVRIQDNVNYQATNRWTILPVARVPIVRLRQNSKQQIQTSGSVLDWGEELEDPFNYYNPAASTDIVIKDPGLYHVDTAIQWDLTVVPDIAAIVLCINGLETALRTHWFQRGGTNYQPGFSQTLSLSGKVRFKADDVVTIKVKYTVAATWLSQIWSYVDGPGKVQSRIDLQYVAV